MVIVLVAPNIRSGTVDNRLIRVYKRIYSFIYAYVRILVFNYLLFNYLHAYSAANFILLVMPKGRELNKTCFLIW
ncbi:MAG: hypothetical protein ACJATN_000759 [Neolewinella sp.]|jgi:hypothetical protein